MTTDRPATEALPRARLHAGTMPATRHSRWMTAECEPGLVSVIIPTHNRAHFLPEAMDSVWTQTYRPIELIVVDDGSTDNTPRMLEEWAKTHSGDSQFALRTFRQENKGAPVARNVGAAMSRGEFILWHDSDDLMLPRRVELALVKLRETGADVCICGFRGWGDRHYVPPDIADHPVFEAVRDGCICMTVLWLYRRRFLHDHNPWREYLVRLQDHFFYHDWLLSSPGPAIASVPLVLVVTRTSRGSVTERWYHTRADFEGRLCYLTEKLAAIQGTTNEGELRRFVASQAAEAAVHSRREFPELSASFMDLWRRSGKATPYGRTWAHRLTWRVGGVAACSLCARVTYLIRHLAGKVGRPFPGTRGHSAHVL